MAKEQRTASLQSNARSLEQLEARKVSVHFGALRAIDKVDLVLRRGEVLGLIGTNGAGKSTLVNALTGFQRPTAGAILVGEREVTGWSPYRVARLGIARTFQAVRVFQGLTVFENVEAGTVSNGFSRTEARALTGDLLTRLHLSDVADTLAGALPHGKERRLGIARALACRPRFLLLDEPGAGLNESESDELVTVLKQIRDVIELGLLVIEHDMRFIARLCERIQVLDHGKTIALGTPHEVKTDPAVLTAYLGSEENFDA